MTHTIYQSGGADEYVTVTIKETTGKDLSSVTWSLALGTYTTAPTSWSAPDDSSVSKSTATLSLLSGTTDPGTYYLWVKAVDDPETIVLRCDPPIVIA